MEERYGFGMVFKFYFLVPTHDLRYIISVSHLPLSMCLMLCCCFFFFRDFSWESYRHLRRTETCHVCARRKYLTYDIQNITIMISNSIFLSIQLLCITLQFQIDNSNNNVVLCVFHNHSTHKTSGKNSQRVGYAQTAS